MVTVIQATKGMERVKLMWRETGLIKCYNITYFLWYTFQRRLKILVANPAYISMIFFNYILYSQVKGSVFAYIFFLISHKYQKMKFVSHFCRRITLLLWTLVFQFFTASVVKILKHSNHVRSRLGYNGLLEFSIWIRFQDKLSTSTLPE